jgi:hypothetical protein
VSGRATFPQMPLKERFDLYKLHPVQTSIDVVGDKVLVRACRMSVPQFSLVNSHSNTTVGYGSPVFGWLRAGGRVIFRGTHAPSGDFASPLLV